MTKVHVVVPVVCMIFLFSAVLIPFANADWAMFHADPSRNGTGSGNPALTSTLLWNYNTGGTHNSWVYSSPAVVNGVVYIGSSQYNGTSPPAYPNIGIVYALNDVNGDEIWNFTTAGPIFESSPAVINGVVYIGDLDGYIYALNATEGKQIWNYHTEETNGVVDNYIYSSPTVVDGVVYFGGVNGNVYALNAANGAYIWSYEVPGSGGSNYVYSSPAVVNGVVYIGSDNGVYALTAANGAYIWNATLGYYAQMSPAVANGIIYVGGYALNATDGALIWSSPTNGGDSTDAVANGIVYMGSDALNATNGEGIWNYSLGPTGQISWSSPTVVAGIVYIGFGLNLTPQTVNGCVCALDAYSGTVIWNYTTDSIIDSSAAVVDGVLYIASDDGNIYALGSPTPTPSPTPSSFPTQTPAPTPNVTPVATLTPSPTPKPTDTPTPTSSATPTITPTSPAPLPTALSIPSSAPTPAPTPLQTSLTTTTSCPTTAPNASITTIQSEATPNPTALPNLNLAQSILPQASTYGIVAFVVIVGIVVGMLALRKRQNSKN